MTFFQDGWDKKQERLLTPEVLRVYITDEGHKVTVYKPTPDPVNRGNPNRGDAAYELIGRALDDRRACD